MLFNSWQYLVFLPLVVLVYYLLPQRFRWMWLLAASYYFYMSWNAKLVLLLLTTTFVTWGTGLLVGRSQTQKAKRLWLALAAAVCLGILFFFKYFNFVSETLAFALSVFGLPVDPFLLSLVLPVGISFYTFQTLSYIIDVYRGAIQPEKHFGIYALFVSFFPQLVAGPIERAANLLPQFREAHTPQPAAFSWGVRTICWGLFKKIVIADTLAPYVDAVYTNLVSYTPMAWLLATLFFAVQIYCDFSGYSDIARGSAALLGFRLMENFNAPYFARSIREFWQRWHISLSTWLQDYVFTPLVWSRWTEKIPFLGKRVKKPPVLSSFLITFFISGLWHGARWTFVLWGLYHGVLSAGSTLVSRRRKKLEARVTAKPARAVMIAIETLCTFALVCLGYVFFRSVRIPDAMQIFAGIPAALSNPIANLQVALTSLSLSADVLVRIGLGALLLTIFDAVQYYRSRDPFTLLSQKKAPVRITVSYGLLMLLLIGVLSVPEGTTMSFIYFQF